MNDNHYSIDENEKTAAGIAAVFVGLGVLLTVGILLLIFWPKG